MQQQQSGAGERERGAGKPTGGCSDGTHNVGRAAAVGPRPGQGRPATCQRCSPGARSPLQRWERAGPGRPGLAPASARPPRFSKCIPPFCFRFPPPHVTRSARPHTHPFSPARPRASLSPVLPSLFSTASSSFGSLGYYDYCDY